MTNNDYLDQLIANELRRQYLKDKGKFGNVFPNPSILEYIQDEEIYTSKDVADLLKFTEQHVTRLCRQNKIYSFQTGPKGEHRILGEEIKRFILSNMNHKKLLRNYL